MAAIDLSQWVQPASYTAAFRDPDFCVWCGSVTRAADGKYYFLYSRWPRSLGHLAWVTHSEVACAVSDQAAGPYRFEKVILPARGAEFWDGLCTHNPTVYQFGGKFYLYHTGNTGDGRATPGELNFSHRNRQRIGVAVAEHPLGPWQRFDRPLIDVSPDEQAPDALMTANPAMCARPGGGYLLVYKCVAKQKPLPFGGPVVHLAATSDSPTGPFKKWVDPIFAPPGSFFAAEDPFIWHDGERYRAIVKDMHGEFTRRGVSLAQFESADGLDWRPSSQPLLTTLDLEWTDGVQRALCKLERPQIYFENGRPAILFCAAAEVGALDDSFNLGIPLRDPAR